jgi:hypothetical protein
MVNCKEVFLRETVRELERFVPIREECDVLVSGARTVGCVVVISVDKSGTKEIFIEQLLMSSRTTTNGRMIANSFYSSYAEESLIPNRIIFPKEVKYLFVVERMATEDPKSHALEHNTIYCMIQEQVAGIVAILRIRLNIKFCELKYRNLRVVLENTSVLFAPKE